MTTIDVGLVSLNSLTTIVPFSGGDGYAARFATRLILAV